MPMPDNEKDWMARLLALPEKLWRGVPSIALHAYSVLGRSMIKTGSFAVAATHGYPGPLIRKSETQSDRHLRGADIFAEVAAKPVWPCLSCRCTMTTNKIHSQTTE